MHLKLHRIEFNVIWLENNNFQCYLYQSLPDQLKSCNYSTCKYYTEDQVNNIIHMETPHLSILHHNIRSMNKYFSQLMGLLLNIDICHVNCKNIANILQHTHKLDSVKPIQTFGGMGIFIKNHLLIDERKDLKIVNENINIENIWYEITDPVTKEFSNVAVINRHPIYTKLAMDTFTNDLERSIDILSKENKKCIICGDININGLKIEKDDNISSFFNMMFSNNYIPHITLPTRITDHSISLIDNILLKESNMICNKITAGNIYNNITDNLPNFIFMEMHRKNRIGERPMIRIYSDKNISTFKTLLSRSDWKYVLK